MTLPWQLILYVHLPGLNDTRRLVKHVSVCLWVCFWKRLAFESVYWIKIILAIAGGHHPICWKPAENKNNRWTALCLGQDIHLLLSDIDTPGSRNFKGPGVNYTTSFPSSSTWRQKIMGLLSLHSDVSQFLSETSLSTIYMCMNTHKHTDSYWYCFSTKL